MTDTSTEAVAKAIAMAGLHGLHGTQEMIRALAAERDAEKSKVANLQIVSDTFLKTANEQFHRAERLERELSKAKSTELAAMPDDATAQIIGEIGNQIHNIGCEIQNDEDLSERLGHLASQAWKAARWASVGELATEEPKA